MMVCRYAQHVNDLMDQITIDGSVSYYYLCFEPSGIGSADYSTLDFGIVDDSSANVVPLGLPVIRDPLHDDFLCATVKSVSSQNTYPSLIY